MYSIRVDSENIQKCSLWQLKGIHDRGHEASGFEGSVQISIGSPKRACKLKGSKLEARTGTMLCFRVYGLRACKLN